MTLRVPVAIVGIGGIFPQAPTLDDFWHTIRDGIDAVRDVPPGRWKIAVDSAVDPSGILPDKVYSPRGCFIDSFRFQPNGLPIDSQWLNRLDPLFHYVLHAGCAAFRDARTEALDRSRIGVIIGNIALPTATSSALAEEFLGAAFLERLAVADPPLITANTAAINRYVTGLPAGILAKTLGLGGGSCTLDAACASSLYALKLAVDELVAGRADAMITGGVNAADPLYTQMGFSQLHALSTSGRCAPFDAAGDGLIVGEGAGMMVVKRLDDALRDRDTIYVVVRGIGLSNDIEGNLLAPSSEGQLRAMRPAYEASGWSPADVDLIECHATGTPVGDRVEFQSLLALWHDQPARPVKTVIGGVKSNIGHLLTGAGAAGLLKVLLAIKNATLPPTANFRQPAEMIDMANSPFEVLQASRPWARRDDQRPRRAAVNAFGFGGINAHVLLEEWLPSSRYAKTHDDTPDSDRSIAVASSTITSTVARLAKVAHPFAGVAIQAHPTRVRHFDRGNRPPPDIAVIGMDIHVGPYAGLDAFQKRIMQDSYDIPSHGGRRWWGIPDSSWYRKHGLSGRPPSGFFIGDVSAPIGKFRIPPTELEEMLPQQLLMLQVAAGAFADASYTPEQGLRTGVFIGLGLDLCTTNFHVRWCMTNWVRELVRRGQLDCSEHDLAMWVRQLRDAVSPPLTANRTMGALGGIVASRVAREFRVGGPSHTVQSEENSGLRALDVAVRALQNHEIDQAFVGSVDLTGDIRSLLGTDADRPFSRSGNVAPFSPIADGTLPSDGAAGIVVKRLDDAIRDGNHIYAVIKGSGHGSGGKPTEVTPTSEAFASAFRRAYADAAIDPLTIEFLETHGSGTPEEDDREAAAINSFFFPTERQRPLFVSGVKPKVGHTGAAAGLVSFVHACLCLAGQYIPANDRLTSSQSKIKSQSLVALQSVQFWLRNRTDGPRRAGVTSASIDGNCTHMVLEEFCAKTADSQLSVCRPPANGADESLFVVRGQTPDELLVQIGRLRHHTQTHNGNDHAELALRWRNQETAGDSNTLAAVVIARNRDQLLQLLDRATAMVQNNESRCNIEETVFYTPNPMGRTGELAYVFPGSGNQYPGMGRALALAWPGVFRQLDDEHDRLRDQFAPELFWHQRNGAPIRQEAKAIILGQAFLGTGVHEILSTFDLRPKAVVGYSLGESVGLFALRAWANRRDIVERINDSTLFTEDLVGQRRAARQAWNLESDDAPSWVAGVVSCPPDRVRKFIDRYPRAYLLIVNTPDECVLGGHADDVNNLVRELGCTFHAIDGVPTVHCPIAKMVERQYWELHNLDVDPPADTRFYSMALGKAYELTADSIADSITTQAVSTVNFSTVVEQAYQDGVRIFVEVGPGNSCTRMISRILKNRPHIARAVCVPGQNESASIRRLLAQLLVEGVSVNLAPLYAPVQRNGRVLETKTGDATRTIVVRTDGLPFSVPQPPVNRAPTPPVEPTVTDTLSQPVAMPPVAEDVVLFQQMQVAAAAVADSHRQYLTLANNLARSMAANIALQMDYLHALADSGAITTANSPTTSPAVSTVPGVGRSDSVMWEPSPDGDAFRRNQNRHREMAPTLDFSRNTFSTEALPDVQQPDRPGQAIPRLDRTKCLEFAIGKIANVLGPEFASIDTYPTRVRLPDEPLMLVDRIMAIEGEPRSMGSGQVITEHDVTADRWYLDNGRIPTCVAVEAGQADLFLSGYLGIDFHTKGLAVYRLLDADVTFHGPLPAIGAVIRYDIHIDNFFNQGETTLFRFRFDGTVDGKLLITMRAGCAGFFTQEELDAGRGIVRRDIDEQPTPGKRPELWHELTPMHKESFTDAQLERLRAGDLPGCFGDSFRELPLQAPLTLPSGNLKLVDRVLEIDPTGGRFGLGSIRAQADIHPDDWFLTCHFVDDKVMPGTLMYECCLHTLRIFLLRMGWVGEKADFVYEPVVDVRSRLKCRGQVLQSTRRVEYEIVIKELGYSPAPFAIADAFMYADGKCIVKITDMSIQLTGLSRERILSVWDRRTCKAVARGDAAYSFEQILAFAVGKPSLAFGDRYQVFDDKRFIARLPGPPYQFLHRILRVEATPWKMVAGGVVTAEYDVPSAAWYFHDHRFGMPFSVLLEVGLQVCGWFSSYVGSALTNEQDLCYRNLGGEATQFQIVDESSGTLTTTAKLTSVSATSGMIVQHFEFEIVNERGSVYKGTTYFGFFLRKALENQIGIRDADRYQPSDEERSRGRSFPYPNEFPFPQGKMRMVDEVALFVPDGGPKGLGFIQGRTAVDPKAWFFKAHFYQDPVWPGSLGLESMLQLLQVVAIEIWGRTGLSRLQTIALNEKHTWIYRGQIIPKDHLVTIDAVITGIDHDRRILHADGYLVVDGRVIYQMINFTLQYE